MKRLLIIIIIALAYSSSHAANFYVRKGAVGANSGTSWADAWSDLDQINWGTVAGANTIYVAGGIYSKQISISASGTDNDNRLIIQRATTSVHGSDLGWDNAWDAQVVITNSATNHGIYFGAGKNHITINGVTSSGILINAQNLSGVHGIAHEYNTGSSNITIRYIEVVGPGWHTSSYDTRALHWSPSTTGDNLLIEFCNFHDLATIISLSGITTVTIRDNTIKNSGAADEEAVHPNHIYCAHTVTPLNIYRNKFINMDVEGILLSSGNGTGTYSIYNNLFYWDESFQGGTYCRGIEFHTSYNWEAATINIYNNTFYNLYWALSNSGKMDVSTTVKNNIFYGISGGNSVWAGVTTDYNWWSGEKPGSDGGGNSISGGVVDPFVNKTALDLSIVATVGATYPKDKGSDLGAPYDTDILSVSRPQGASWDIGAYEYTSGSTYVLTITKSGSGAGTVTSNVGGIDCGSTCTYDYNGTVVTLTATATSPNYFAGWSGEGCSGTSTCQVTMSAAKSVTATFSRYGVGTIGAGGQITFGTGGSITLQ